MNKKNPAKNLEKENKMNETMEGILKIYNDGKMVIVIGFNNEYLLTGIHDAKTGEVIDSQRKLRNSPCLTEEYCKILEKGKKNKGDCVKCWQEYNN